MSIRFPIELAAAAEYAERAVDTILTPAPTAREVRFADATHDLGRAGEPIRIAFGRGFVTAVPSRQPVPGQTCH